MNPIQQSIPPGKGWTIQQEEIQDVDGHKIKEIVGERIQKGFKKFIQVVCNIFAKLLPCFSEEKAPKSWRDVFAGKEIKVFHEPIEETPPNTINTIAPPIFTRPATPSSIVIQSAPEISKRNVRERFGVDFPESGSLRETLTHAQNAIAPPIFTRPAIPSSIVIQSAPEISKRNFRERFGVDFPESGSLRETLTHAQADSLKNVLVEKNSDLLTEPENATIEEKAFVSAVNEALTQKLHAIKEKFQQDRTTPTAHLYGAPTLRSMAALQERLGANFVFGEAIDTGDCLYDAFAKVLDQAIPEGHPQRHSLLEALGGECTHKSIRHAIHAYIKVHKEEDDYAVRGDLPAFLASGDKSMDDILREKQTEIEAYKQRQESLITIGMQSTTLKKWQEFLNAYKALPSPNLGAPEWGDFDVDANALHSFLKEKGITIAFTIHMEKREIVSEETVEELDEEECEREGKRQPGDLLGTLQEGAFERIATSDKTNPEAFVKVEHFDRRQPGYEGMEGNLPPLPETTQEVHLGSEGGRHFFPIFKR